MSRLTHGRFNLRSDAGWREQSRSHANVSRPLSQRNHVESTVQGVRSSDVPDDSDTLPLDRTVLDFFCAWVLFQCFFYAAVPLLRWNVGITVSPDRVALVALLIVLIRHITSVSKSPTTARGGKAVGRLAFIFAGITLWSWLVHAPDAKNATFGNLTWIMNLAVYPTLSFYVATRLHYTRPMLKRLMWFFGALGVYLAITGIAEHFDFELLVYPKYILDPGVGTHYGRSRGPFVDTISNGGMLVVGFSALCYIAASLTGVRRRVALTCAVLVVPAVYFTETRSVWLGWAAVAGTLVSLRTPLRRIATPVAGVLLVAFVLGIGSKFSLSDATLFSRRLQTVDYRLDNYQIAWDAFKANPWFGVGYGMFFNEWRNYADLNHSRVGIGLADGNHSTWLGILAELGLAGALPFTALVACAAIMCFSAYRQLKRTGTESEQQFAVVTIGLLQSFLVLSLTNDLKAMPTVNIVAFWFLGVLSSVVSARLASAKPVSDAAAPVKPLPSQQPATVRALRSRAIR